MTHRLTLGWAERELPDGSGQDLSGLLERANPSTGTRDELHARAAYLHDGKVGVVWVSVDVLGLPQSLVERVRAAASAAHRLPPRSFAIAATHTHSAPATLFMANCGLVDRGWIRDLENTLIDVIADAVNGPKTKVSLRLASRSVPGLTYNRRTHTEDGTPRSNNGHRDGTLDTSLSAVVAEDVKSGDPVAAFLHFACHPVFYTDQLMSPDWPGDLVARTNRALGGGFRSMFIQGACGDVNPLRLGTEAETDMNRMSAGLAEVATDLIGTPTEGEYLAPKVNARLRSTDLDWRGEIPDDELERYLLSPADWTRSGRREQALHIWAKRVLVSRARGWWADGLRIPVQVVTLGELVIASAGGELFGETNEALRATHSDRPVLTAGYVNDLAGYIPPAGEYPHGGYEIARAHQYFGYPEAFSADAERVVRETIGDILRVGTMSLAAVS